MWRRSPSRNSRTAFCCASAEKLPTARSVSSRWSRIELSQAYQKARTAKSSDAWRAAMPARNSPSPAASSEVRSRCSSGSLARVPRSASSLSSALLGSPRPASRPGRAVLTRLPAGRAGRAGARRTPGTRQGARGTRDPAAAEAGPLAGAVPGGHGTRRTGPGRPACARAAAPCAAAPGPPGTGAEVSAAHRRPRLPRPGRGQRLAGGLQVKLVNRRRHRRQGRGGLRPRIDQVRPASQRLRVRAGPVSLPARPSSASVPRQRVTADLIEHLVGPPGFLGADDRGPGPRAAADTSVSPPSRAYSREVFGCLPGRRLAETVERRARGTGTPSAPAPGRAAGPACRRPTCPTAARVPCKART